MLGRFVPLDGFHTTLESNVKATHDMLYIDRDVEQELLDDYLTEYDDWTTLAVYDGVVMEVVQVQNYCGRLVYNREFAGTDRHAFPCGSRVEYILTAEGVRRLVCDDDFMECPDV